VALHQNTPAYVGWVVPLPGITPADHGFPSTRFSRSTSHWSEDGLRNALLQEARYDPLFTKPTIGIAVCSSQRLAALHDFGSGLPPLWLKTGCYRTATLVSASPQSTDIPQLSSGARRTEADTINRQAWIIPADVIQ
jgi:hypothetical protein